MLIFNLLSANKSLRCLKKRGISLPSCPLLNFAHVFGGLCCSHLSFLVVSCPVACCLRVLSWRSLSRLVSVMSCLVLSLLVFLVLPCLVLSSLALFCFVGSCLVLSCLLFSYLVLFLGTRHQPSAVIAEPNPPRSADTTQACIFSSLPEPLPLSLNLNPKPEPEP